jgi:hypothetical protein
MPKYKIGDTIELCSEKMLIERGWRRSGDIFCLEINGRVLNINFDMIERFKKVKILEVISKFSYDYQYLVVENDWQYNDLMLKDSSLKYKCKKCLKKE